MRRQRDLNLFLERAARSLTEMAGKQDALGAIKLAELPARDTLVVSIDMNRGFAEAGALYSDRVRDICSATGVFLTACRERGYEVLPFSDCHLPSAVELQSYPPHCLAGTPEHELVDELSEFSGQVVPKNCTNGFLAVDIDWSAYKNVVVTGCCTDICIYQFAVTLKGWYNEKNIAARVIVPLDLVETYDAPWHDADLMETVFVDSMMSNGAEVVAKIEL